MKRSVLFIDESGKASLAELKNDPFIITGVILDTEDIRTIEGFFNYIKRKYSIPTDIPFHSYEIFENPKTKLSDHEAKDLIERLADFISIIPIEIKILSIDKAAFKKALGVKSNSDFKGNAKRKELAESPYRLMSSNLFQWFANHLSKTGGIGEIIVDARRGGDAQLIKTLYTCKEQSGPFDENTRSLIKEKCTSICFAEKTCLSGGLEITDIISFTSFQHSKRLIKSFDKIKLQKLWKAVRLLLKNKSTHRISPTEIRKFFAIKKNGVHKTIKLTY